MGHPAGVRRDFEAMEERRMEAMRLLKSGVGPVETARRLGVHRQSVYRWQQALATQGKKGLRKAGRAGRKPRLSPKQFDRLRKVLLEGPEAYGYPNSLWTCPRVAGVIEQEFGVEFHEAHVWRLLRGRLGFSPQRPTGRAIERDEKAIARWKRERWPALKKTPKSRAKPSSSSMRAG
jgi:transposase